MKNYCDIVEEGHGEWFDVGVKGVKLRDGKGGFWIHTEKAT